MEDHHGIGESFYSITCSKIMLATCSLVVMTLMTLSWDKLNPLSDYMLLSSLLIVAYVVPYWLLQGVGNSRGRADHLIRPNFHFGGLPLLPHHAL